MQTRFKIHSKFEYTTESLMVPLTALKSLIRESPSLFTEAQHAKLDDVLSGVSKCSGALQHLDSYSGNELISDGAATYRAVFKDGWAAFAIAFGNLFL